MTKIFDIIIGEQTYGVYDIPSKEHPGWNGEPKTWWIYFCPALPQGVLPPIDSDNWEPWQSTINRRCWDIRFKERNYTKIKWDDRDFRSNLSCEMYCNNKLVYRFGAHDLNFAMSKAQYLIVKLSEHPYNFFDTQEEYGRKIWWYGLPATVKPKSEGWEIGIVPDYSTGIDKKTWWAEFIRRRSNINEKPDPNDIEVWDGEDDHSDYINWGDAFSDGHIDWFRKVDKPSATDSSANLCSKP